MRSLSVGSSKPSIAARISSNRIVDDAVEAHIDAFTLSQRSRLRLRTNIETDHDRLGGRRQQNIRFGKPPTPLWMTRNFTAPTGIFSTAEAGASAEPYTSALMTKGNSLTLPS